MHRIDSEATSASLPTPAAVGATVGYFTEGVPGSIPATVVSDDWLNAVQEELAYVIEQSGGTLDKTSRVQLKAAIDLMINGGGAPLSKAFANTPFLATVANKTILWNSSGGACEQQLPAASTCPGAIFTIALMTAGNNLTINPDGADLINGDSTMVLSVLYSSVRLLSISTGWLLIG